MPSEALTPLAPLSLRERGEKHADEMWCSAFLPPLPPGEEGRGGGGFGGHAAKNVERGVRRVRTPPPAWSYYSEVRGTGFECREVGEVAGAWPSRCVSGLASPSVKRRSPWPVLPLSPGR